MRLNNNMDFSKVDYSNEDQDSINCGDISMNNNSFMYGKKSDYDNLSTYRSNQNINKVDTGLYQQLEEIEERNETINKYDADYYQYQTERQQNVNKQIINKQSISIEDHFYNTQENNKDIVKHFTFSENKAQ